MKKYTHIGNRLKELRGNISQKEFAKNINISFAAYQNYEYGKRIPPGPVLSNIAKICNVTTDYILAGESVEYAYRNIGRRLKELRSPIDMMSFTKWLGVTIPQYAKYERGEMKPPQKILKQIAEKRNTSVDWILSGDDEPRHNININTDINKKNIKSWIDGFWQKASNEEKIWFKIQFQQAFPGYKEWLLKKKIKK